MQRLGVAAGLDRADRFERDHEGVPARIRVAAVVIDLAIERAGLAGSPCEGAASAGRAGDMRQLGRTTRHQ